MLARARSRFLAGLEVGRAIRRGATSRPGYPAALTTRLHERSDAFLATLKDFIFATPWSPYRALLMAAGYDFPRLEDLTRSLGVEETLAHLRRDGVYVTVPEFKGREPIRRNGRVLFVSEADFRNPRFTVGISVPTSGSRGRPLPTVASVDHLWEVAPYRHWIETQWGLTDRPLVLLQTPGAGLANLMLYAMVGRVPVRWFSPVPGSSPSSPSTNWGGRGSVACAAARRTISTC